MSCHPKVQVTQRITPACRPPKQQVVQSTAFGNLSAFLRRGEGWDIRQEQRKGVKWENERENNGDGEILGEKIVKKEIIHFFFLTLPPSFAMTPIV